MPDHDVAARLAVELSPLLAARPTAAHPAGLRSVRESLERRLAGLGFDVRRHTVDAAPEVLVATRRGQGDGHIALAGHYDVEEPGEGWTHEPFAVTLDSGRLFGRGLADNLGPLCLRLLALDQLGEHTPTLTFVLQGEEEVGSPTAHQIFPTLALPAVDIWLEETGYFELDGSQRLLVRRPNSRTAGWVGAAVAAAHAAARPVHQHDRYLNKAFGEQRCPFLTHLAGGATYLAIGPNDPASVIHQANESLAVANLSLSISQFQAVLVACAEGT